MAIFTLTASKATPRKGIRYIMDKDKLELWHVWNLDPNADLAQQMIDTQRLWKKDMSEQLLVADKEVKRERNGQTG